ncbi:hypothetical protein H702_07190 [Streptococcus equinus JB1]|uniref:Sporulation protein Cse60 n=1 Tax=Streptococcus equinus JB1 TaxID=1294274 RepID=A0A091BP47_STREI|nr:sporulation protein Cse60 [Streptococcus equinus]KFN87436.1 hypothetical protein H702_07190 [Streptococcus equinus JB1]QBX15708.1 hypothetical protein Javan207_0022 [Streptococcus phage Javan207]SFL15924.1 Protein of unknown function [Streptococcus equinus JB1]
MNKVKFFHHSIGSEMEKNINEFAEEHEIINVSYTSEPSSTGFYSVQAMVLYRSK